MKEQPDEGVGITFININNEKCITLPRDPPIVHVVITSFRGIVAFAEHFYATLRIPTLSCKTLDKPTDNTFTTNSQPEESRGKRIDISAPAKKDWYEDNARGGKFRVLREGDITTRFDSIKDCIEAIELTFNQHFEPPWTLKRELDDLSWAETKIEFLKMYGE